jgi:glycosyltransferase involved in cell wall biosynthesis
MAQGKRVVFIQSWTGSFVLIRFQMLKALVDAGCEVIAIAGKDETLEKAMHLTDIEGRMESIGVKVRHLTIDRTGTNPLRDFGTFVELRRTLRSLKPDIVFTNTAKPVVYGTLAAKLAGVSTCYAMISGLGYAFGEAKGKGQVVNRILKGLYRQALNRNDAVFFQNPDDLEFFVREGLVKDRRKAVRIAGSGVDVDHFEAELPKAEFPSFLVIARPLKEKGLYEYAEAAKKLKAKYPNLRCSWAGIIDTNPSCIPQETLNEWHDQGILEYLGSSGDVRPFIESHTVNVLASYYREGVPRSLLEAMSMSRPLITTDSPGCREAVEHGENGFLIPPRDSDALADAMEKFILDPNLIPRMGWRSREMALETFDVRKVNETILRTMGFDVKKHSGV